MLQLKILAVATKTQYSQININKKNLKRKKEKQSRSNSFVNQRNCECIKLLSNSLINYICFKTGSKNVKNVWTFVIIQIFIELK